MKKILVVSNCSVRSSGRGLTSDFLRSINPGNGEVSIDVYDISIMKNHKRDDYDSDDYFSIPVSPLTKMLSKNRITRAICYEQLICKEFGRILHSRRYNLIIIFQVQRFSDRIIKIAKNNNVKTGLYPWGSDILRCNIIDSYRLKKAFRDCDYIIGYKGSVVLRTVVSRYHADSNKIFSHSLVTPGVGILLLIKEKYTRKEMHDNIGIPYSDYNIICGYNADPGQQHFSSIEGLSEVKDLLPNGYQIVFPVSYGNRNGYIDSLKRICKEKALNAVFIEKFISDEQMAMLHIITDLYINNQKTDNGNAFLIEALSCGNCIVSGAWLKYNQFEEYGIPYYQFNNQEELGDVIKVILSEKPQSITVPIPLMRFLQSITNDTLKSEWCQLFNNL